jgi:peptidoglycan LD-endopeptidase LytH
MAEIGFEEKLSSLTGHFHPVVPFDKERDKIVAIDFTQANPLVAAGAVDDTEKLAIYIDSHLRSSKARYAIGGYAELRSLYARSRHFDTSLSPPGARGFENQNPQQARRLHLGTDIWGPAGTRVMAPLGGIVHSFAFNNHDGDYGATIIITHNLNGLIFHSLYGHLSLNSLKNLQAGQRIRTGEVFTEMGMRFENGNWPPHLHFQLILDMDGWEGDYPGVCAFLEGAKWLKNSPNPDLLLDFNRYI